MKNQLTYILVFFSMILFGQQIEKITEFKSPVVNKEFKLKPDNKIPYRIFGSTWFNVQSDLINLSVLSSSATSLKTFPIFPDSTIYLGLNSSNEPVSAWLHGAGDIINPSMTPSNWIDAWGETIIDSIDIFKGYTRMTASSVVDTLFVDFLKSANATAYLDVSTNGSYDPGEFLMQPIGYDQPNNRLYNNQIKRTDTILLTEADSSTYVTSTLIDVNDTVKGGERYGIYVRFVPGFTWTSNDDTLTKYNTFYMTTREQETGKSPVQYWADNAGFASYVLPVNVRYNQAGGSNGNIIPTFAYADSWEYEHHYIWYKITSNELGIKDVDLNVQGVGTYPNPAINSTTVSFNLSYADEVEIRITDLSGRTVKRIDLGNLSAGDHLKNVDLSVFGNGNYILSVNRSSKIITVVR